MRPGDYLVISHFRDASAGNPDDTYADKINILKVLLEGTFYF